MAASSPRSSSSSSSANIRTTLIAAVAIPTSIISTFALMAAMGFTLNQITMLALTLMVGIVIDDAIIVLENIYPLHRREAHAAVPGGHPGHARDRPRRHGHHALAARRLPAGRLHGRHRRPLHVLVRVHLGVRHRGLAARVLHADADALPAGSSSSAQAAGKHSLQGLVVFRHLDHLVHADARLVDGTPQGGRRRSASSSS